MNGNRQIINPVKENHCIRKQGIHIIQKAAVQAAFVYLLTPDLLDYHFLDLFIVSGFQPNEVDSL